MYHVARFFLFWFDFYPVPVVTFFSTDSKTFETNDQWLILTTRTSAGVYVLSASRLSDKMVLVEPGAVFCHHHGLGSPLSPSVNHLWHGIGVWNRMRPSKQAIQEEPFRFYYDAANTHWVQLVWVLMGLFGPFSIKQLAEGQENKFD